MPNENIENQNNQVKRNPTRNNTNVNQGQTNEKTFSGQNPSHGVEINPGTQVDRTEIDLDRNGVSNAEGAGTNNFGSGDEADQGSEQQGSDNEAQRLQSSRGADGANSQVQQQQPQAPQAEQQQSQQQSGEPSGRVKEDTASMTGTGMDDDEDDELDTDEDAEQINAAGGNNGGMGANQTGGQGTTGVNLNRGNVQAQPDGQV